MKSSIRGALFAALPVFCCLIAGSAAASEAAEEVVVQESQPTRPVRLNRITAGPFSLLDATLSLEYERALSGAMTIYFGPRIIALPGDLSANGVEVYGGGTSAGMRFFLFGEAPRGLWAGPELNASLIVASSGPASAGAFAVSCLGTAGYTFVTGGGFTGSFGAGIGLRTTTVAATDDLLSIDGYLGLALGVHAQLGYAF